MGSQGQKEKNWESVAVDARVNGQKVARASRARGGDRLHYNPDINCLINELPAELGEKGQSIDPAGGGGGNPADNWPAIERMHRSRFAVAKWRRLNGVMIELCTETQTLLRKRYRIAEREHSQVVGLRAAFGDLAVLAWHLCEDKERMRPKLSSGKAGGDREITQLRNRVTVVNRRIHSEWLDAERAQALDFKCPPRVAE